jgi:hypothetical protein
MSKALRWRVLVLQAGLIVILGAVAGFTLWASSYVQSSVTTQLAAQNITFPAYNSASIKALPAVDATAMNQFAGQKLTTGPQAEVWANNFMKVHLSAMPTYDAASAAARANPTNAKDAATLTTVFEGTMLRGTLLNAYGWWSLGTYTGFAGISAPWSSSSPGGGPTPVQPAQPGTSPPRTARRARCLRSASPR